MLKKIGAFLICAFLMVLVFNETSDAGRRFGGGKSFGSKPAYRQPATPQRQASSQPNQGTSPAGGLQNPASRGLFGGMGGMLGGFLMGGMLGSLLFGGARPFSGPGLMDLLLVGGAVFLLLRFLKSRRSPTMQTAGGMPFGQGSTGGYSSDSAFPGGLSGWTGSRSDHVPHPGPVVPEGFDVENFLKGAKAAYHRLQSSWDKREWEDLRHFTTPEVMNELQRQAEQYPATGETELLSVTAEILEVRTTGDETVASVLFDVLMREDADQKEAQQVREIWHFRRHPSAADSFWVLEGIQQTE